MTAEAILDSLRRANPVCVICHGASSHPPIVGDHDVVSLQPCPVHVGGCWRWDGWL